MFAVASFCRDDESVVFCLNYECTIDSHTQ